MSMVSSFNFDEKIKQDNGEKFDLFAAIKNFFNPKNNGLMSKKCPNTCYIYKDLNSMDQFNYLLKEKNPTLKNIVSDNVIFPYLSNGKFSNKDCCFIPFEYSKIHKIINTTSNSKYWLFIPFGDKYYIEEAQLFLSKNKKIKSIKYYTFQQ